MDVRKQRMDQLKTSFEAKSYKVEYITDYDPNMIVQSDITTHVNLNRNNTGDLYDNLVKNMHITQISNALKHKVAITRAAQDDAADYTLIIEDDVLCGDDIVTKVSEILDKLNADKENEQLVFLGLPSLMPIDEAKGTFFRPTTDFYRLLPCCDSYIASRKTFKKLHDVYGPVKFTTNLQLSFLCETNKITSSMATPNLFLDGSKYGAYLSSIDPNGRLIFNPDYNRLALLIAKGSFTPDEDTTIVSALKNIKFNNHPDVMHLEAQYHIAKGNYTKAEELLNTVYTICSQNACVINTETEFLRTHMRMYKNLQDIKA